MTQTATTDRSALCALSLSKGTRFDKLTALPIGAVERVVRPGGISANRPVLLTCRRGVLPHVDHIFGTVINVPLARFQGGSVRLTDDCLKEARLTLINHEVSHRPLLAPENLALQHPLSIPHRTDAPAGLGDGDEA
jgi:hypothetical protein